MFRASLHTAIMIEKRSFKCCPRAKSLLCEVWQAAENYSGDAACSFAVHQHLGMALCLDKQSCNVAMIGHGIKMK